MSRAGDQGEGVGFKAQKTPHSAGSGRLWHVGHVAFAPKRFASSGQWGTRSASKHVT